MRTFGLLPSLLIVLATTLQAQATPPYVPSNPVLASRSPLYVQPIVPAGPGWRVALVLDYANAIETATAVDRRKYQLDAELSQFDIWLGRDLGAEWFGIVNVPIREVHDGMLDAFLNGYHDLIGLPVPARNRRPKDTYGWTFALPDQSLDIPRPHGPFLGDVRLGVGRRFGTAQAILTATLPTATTDIGAWSRGTLGVGLDLGVRLVDSRRVHVDGSVMAGYTPTHGPLAAYQRTAFVGASAGFWWRVVGQQAIYASTLLQSANWKATGFSAMESAEATLDAGMLLKFGRGWPTVQLGLSEDLVPRGPAVDVAARIGVLW
ncbi:MAG: DUF3187 family protein [Gemmatimonadota bacterium]